MAGRRVPVGRSRGRSGRCGGSLVAWAGAWGGAPASRFSMRGSEQVGRGGHPEPPGGCSAVASSAFLGCGALRNPWVFPRLGAASARSARRVRRGSAGAPPRRVPARWAETRWRVRAWRRPYPPFSRPGWARARGEPSQSCWEVWGGDAPVLEYPGRCGLRRRGRIGRVPGGRCGPTPHRPFPGPRAQATGGGLRAPRPTTSQRTGHAPAADGRLPGPRCGHSVRVAP